MNKKVSGTFFCDAPAPSANQGATGGAGVTVAPSSAVTEITETGNTKTGAYELDIVSTFTPTLTADGANQGASANGETSGQTVVTIEEDGNRLAGTFDG